MPDQHTEIIATLTEAADDIVSLVPTALEACLWVGPLWHDPRRPTALDRTLSRLTAAAGNLTDIVSRRLEQQFCHPPSEELVRSVAAGCHVATRVHDRLTEKSRADGEAAADIAGLHRAVTEELAPIADVMLSDARAEIRHFLRHNADLQADILRKGLASLSALGREIQMIAINAAIEAARVGEDGRGFAVISQEIRGLSAASETSLNDLSRLLASRVD